MTFLVKDNLETFLLFYRDILNLNSLLNHSGIQNFPDGGNENMLISWKSVKHPITAIF